MTKPLTIPMKKTDDDTHTSVTMKKKVEADGGAMVTAEQGSIRVRCCGRWCAVGRAEALSIPTLTAAIRQELNMQTHTPLSIRDPSNRPLRTDQDLAKALSK